MQRRQSAQIFLYFLILAMSIRVGGQDTSSENPPGRVGRISYLQGSVSFLRAGVDQWSEAALNFPVTTGDRLYTDKRSWAEIETGPFTGRLSSETDMTVTELNDQILQLGLDQGVVRLSIYDFPSGNVVEVDTPNVAITAQRPGRYRVETDPDGNRTRVIANRGSLQVSGTGFAQSVEEGQAFEFVGQNPPQAKSIPISAPDAFDVWVDGRDRHREASSSSKYVSAATPGYDDLDGTGHWDVVADYGPIWYPPVAPDWMPYRFGHWAWIDPWGWSWIEDESWGFCQFHFGRWVLIGANWGWLPGPLVPAPIYTPALVAFLGGPGFTIGIGAGLVGWFPLGPGEPFSPWYHYDAEYLRAVNITNIRNVTNITNITNINNVNYKYRTVAATAISARAFSSAQPVAHNVVKVRPEQLAKAQVIPHPPVNPTRSAVASGKPVKAPPVRPHPVVASVRARPGGPTADVKRAPPGTRGRDVPAQRTELPTRPEAPRWVTRRTPPPSPVPFADARRAMMAHPGRPLEPAQLGDVRARRPVRPMVDHEFPPHAAPIVRERPRGPVSPKPKPH